MSAGLETAHGSCPKIRAVLEDAAAVLQEVAKEGGAPTCLATGSNARMFPDVPSRSIHPLVAHALSMLL